MCLLMIDTPNPRKDLLEFRRRVIGYLERGENVAKPRNRNKQGAHCMHSMRSDVWRRLVRKAKRQARVSPPFSLASGILLVLMA